MAMNAAIVKNLIRSRLNISNINESIRSQYGKYTHMTCYRSNSTTSSSFKSLQDSFDQSLKSANPSNYTPYQLHEGDFTDELIGRPDQGSHANDGSINNLAAHVLDKHFTIIRVDNLRKNVSWQVLKDYMRFAGDVKRSYMLYDDNDMKTGSAIVEFVTHQGAKTSIEKFHGQLFRGSIISVAPKSIESSFTMSKSNPTIPVIGCRVFVGNLHYHCTVEDLRHHISQYVSDIVFIEMFFLKDGRSRGCGIVTFQSSQDARQAIEKIHDTVLMNRKVLVREDREEMKDIRL